MGVVEGLKNIFLDDQAAHLPNPHGYVFSETRDSCPPPTLPPDDVEALERFYKTLP